MNSMRWNCLESGCFNHKLRLKLGVFDDCFPGLIAFGDLDGMVEISGSFCLLEWKSSGSSLNRAQQFAFLQFTRLSPNNVVFVAEGDAKTMEVRRYCVFWKGQQRGWHTEGLESLKERVSKWAAYVGRPRLRVVHP